MWSLAAPESDALEAKVTRNGVSLCGQALFLLSFTGVLVRERYAAAECTLVQLWSLASALLIGMLFVIQAFQFSRAGCRRTSLDPLLHVAFRLLVGALLVHCFIGIGVHTRSAKCSLTNPLIWWTGFFVASVILLLLISQLFIMLSGLYLRKTMLRRGIEGLYYSTDGSDELLTSSHKGQKCYGVSRLMEEPLTVRTLP